MQKFQGRALKTAWRGRSFADWVIHMQKKTSSRIFIGATLALSFSFGIGLQDAAESRTSAAPKARGKEDAAACRSCVSQAASLFAANKLEAAASLLRASSAKCPSNAQLHLMLSTIVVRLGSKTDEALQEAALAIAAAPDSQAAHLQYGMTLHAAEKYAQAATEFEAVTNLNPGSYEAWSALADVYKRLRQDDDAKTAGEKAASLEPGTQQVRLAVLQNLKRTGKYSQARKELKRLLSESANAAEFDQSLANEALQIGAYDEAIEASTRVIKAYPNSAGPVKTLAISQFLKHQYADAEASADKILSEKQKSGETSAIRGICRMKTGKSKESTNDIDLALTLEPASGLVMFADGMRKVANGDFENGAEQLRLASEAGAKGSSLDKIPQSLGHLALSQLYRKQGLITEAIQEAHAAGVDRRFESDAMAMEARALLEDKTASDNLAAASKLAENAVLSDPNNSEAFLSKSMCELQSGKADLAKQSADKAIALSPYNAEAYLLLAKISGVRGNKSESEQLIEKGIKLEPKDPELLMEKAKILLAQNKASDATELLKQAMDRVVRKPDLSFVLAEACEKAGETSESLKYYKLSLTQGLSGDNSSQAKAAIARLETK